MIGGHPERREETPKSCLENKVERFSEKKMCEGSKSIGNPGAKRSFPEEVRRESGEEGVNDETKLVYLTSETKDGRW
jgi:hypothetical protein